MKIYPFVLGHGRAGDAVSRALAIVGLSEPELGLQAPTFVKRGDRLTVHPTDLSVLVVTNPHALHADAIRAADAAGFAAVLCEKPSCVSLDQARSLEEIKLPVAILHVYRQTWGARVLRSLIDQGQLGQIIGIEGRYWQSSAAERALATPTAEQIRKAWKNDIALSGPSDTLLDVGVHWADFAAYLMGTPPTRARVWKSFVNAESAHRDTHVQLTLGFAGGARGSASISKTVHGATNDFSATIVGAKASASWSFLAPDEIVIGSGRDRRVLTRPTADLGTRQPAFHGAGWIEGYVEIARALLREVAFKERGEYPRLAESLGLMRTLLTAEIDSL